MATKSEENWMMHYNELIEYVMTNSIRKDVKCGENGSDTYNGELVSLSKSKSMSLFIDKQAYRWGNSLWFNTIACFNITSVQLKIIAVR